MKIQVVYESRNIQFFDDLVANFNWAWRKIRQLSAKRQQQSPPTQLELWQQLISDNIMVHCPLG